MSASTINCRFCDTPFERDTSLRNWRHINLCSDKCRKGVAAKAKRDSRKPTLPVPTDCKICGKTFTPKQNVGKRQKYCSNDCYMTVQSEKSRILWAAQKEPRNCEKCGDLFVPVKYGSGKQIYCSKKCQISASSKRNGGRFRRPYSIKHEFEVVRPAVLARDKVCVLCGSDDRLQVHHWDNSGRRDDCDNSLDNLAVLCGSCHTAIHKVTLAKKNGEWYLEGRIFEVVKLEGSVRLQPLTSLQ